MNFVSLGLCLFEEGFSLNLFRWFISLRFLNRWAWEPHEIMESWGFCFHERTIHLNWGRHCKVIRMPWDMDHIKCEVMRPDGTWTKKLYSYETDEPDGRWQETYDFTYTLKSGEVQHRKATIHVVRREWRWRWFMWCPLLAKRRQSIDILFNDEVGERTGSWKGGVIGTGCEMRPGETPLDTLRRFEREERF